jgi:rhodanese-related sulfurtransferase
MSGGQGGYVGDVDPDETMRRLEGEPNAQLVDVRTRAEWDTVGVPDLSRAGKTPIFLEWQVAPAMQVAPDFLDRLAAELKSRGVGRDAPLYFLCRSGARSAAAATAATAAGFTAAYNVAEGFEGKPGASEQLGRPVGWKNRKLPWTRHQD